MRGQDQTPTERFTKMHGPYDWANGGRQMENEIKLQSDGASVRDPYTVRRILNKYETRGIHFRLRKEKNEVRLVVTAVEVQPTLREEPLAILKSQLPDRAGYPDDEAYSRELEKAFDEGDYGLKDLLREIAAYLTTPLLIVELQHSPISSSVRFWRVEPGDEYVETLAVSN
jgi:hypothetical protein